MELTLVTASTTTPVSLAEAKAHLYVTASDDDTMIAAMVTAARIQCEKIADRAFVTQTWYAYFDEFPEYHMRITKSPMTSVTAITYYDADGALQTLSASDYQVDSVSEPARIALAPTASWPATEAARLNAVRVEFVAGVAVADVPKSYKQAIMMAAAHFYANREAVLTGGISKEIELALGFLLWPDRIYTAA